MFKTALKLASFGFVFFQDHHLKLKIKENWVRFA